jgi:hypothetical protein
MAELCFDGLWYEVDGVIWLSRSFNLTDETLDKWKAIGFAIAADIVPAGGYELALIIKAFEPSSVPNRSPR